MTLEAAELLGKMVHAARRERRMTEEDLAGRAGTTRKTLQRIERGDPRCAIGLYFEVAAIVGVKLFETDDRMALRAQSQRLDDRLAVLPSRVRMPTKVNDEF